MTNGRDMLSKADTVAIAAIEKRSQARRLIGTPRISPLQRQIQKQHVHSWFSENTETTATSVLLQQRGDLGNRNTSRLGHALHLECRIGRADVRIQTGG